MQYLIYKLACVCILATALSSCRGKHDKGSGSALKIIDGLQADSTPAIPLIKNSEKSCSAVIVEDDEGQKFLVTALHCLATKGENTYLKNFENHAIYYPQINDGTTGSKITFDASSICYNQNFFTKLSSNEFALQNSDEEHRIIGEAAAYDLAVINVTKIAPFNKAPAFRLGSPQDLEDSEAYLRKPPRIGSMPEYVYRYIRPHFEGLVAGWGMTVPGKEYPGYDSFNAKHVKTTPAENHGLLFGFNSMASGDSGAPLIVKENSRPIIEQETEINPYLYDPNNKVFAIGVTSNHSGKTPYNFSVDLTSATSRRLFELAKTHDPSSGKSCEDGLDGGYESSFLSTLTIENLINGMGGVTLDKVKGKKPALYPIGTAKNDLCQGLMLDLDLDGNGVAQWFVTPNHCIANSSIIDDAIITNFCNTYDYLNCSINNYITDTNITFIKQNRAMSLTDNVYSIFSEELVYVESYFASYKRVISKRLHTENYENIVGKGPIAIRSETDAPDQDECYLETDGISDLPFIWLYNSDKCKIQESDMLFQTPFSYDGSDSGGVYYDVETGNVLCMIVKQDHDAECIDLTIYLNQ